MFNLIQIQHEQCNTEGGSVIFIVGSESADFKFKVCNIICLPLEQLKLRARALEHHM